MRVITRVACILALGVAMQPAFAQSTCGELNSAIETQLKSAALEDASGLVDDSAQSMVDVISVNNHLQMARADIALMAQNKCPPRQSPLDYKVYAAKAIICALAVQKGEKNSPECDQSTWHANNSGSTAGGDGG